jgi:hypothetical protein
MKKENIKKHLAAYLIFQKRKTTINHAFASAIAPVVKYDVVKLEAAIRSLGQDPDGHLKCVYCDGDATTWDHLVSLVAKGEFRGNGHQIGNLVPCCGACNSNKGAKSWDIYLRSKTLEPGCKVIFEDRCKVIADYADKYAVVVDPKAVADLCPVEWKQYNEIKKQILSLMKDADKIAAVLQAALLAHEAQGHNTAVQV